MLFAALVAIIPMRLAGVDGRGLGRTFGRTFKQLRLPLVTIAFILSMAT